MTFNTATSNTLSYNSSAVETRVATGTVSLVAGSTLRRIGRVSVGAVGASVGSAFRTIGRVATGTVAPIVGTASRDVALARAATGFTEPVVGTATRAYLDWQLVTDSGAAIGPSVTVVAGDVTADPETLTLVFETDRDALSQWRALDRAGDIQREPGYGGRYRVLDRAGRADWTEARPPGDQAPPFAGATGYVQSYQEEQVHPDRYRISLTLARGTNRSEAFGTVSQTGDWEFETPYGTVGLDAGQVSQTSRKGTVTAGTTTMALAVDSTQAAALCDAWGFPDAVVEEPVPDGENRLVDESEDSRQTVKLSTPDGAGLPDGDYFVQGWALRRLGFSDSREWQLEITLAE